MKRELLAIVIPRDTSSIRQKKKFIWNRSQNPGFINFKYPDNLLCTLALNVIVFDYEILQQSQKTVERVGFSFIVLS